MRLLIIFESVNRLLKENRISAIFRSKRCNNHTSILEKCLSWCASVASNESIINYDIEEIIALANFPDTFYDDHCSSLATIFSIFSPSFVFFSLLFPLFSSQSFLYLTYLPTYSTIFNSFFNLHNILFISRLSYFYFLHFILLPTLNHHTYVLLGP